jgi:outer membrane protein assembly factor BamA
MAQQRKLQNRWLVLLGVLLLAAAGACVALAVWGAWTMMANLPTPLLMPGTQTVQLAQPGQKVYSVKYVVEPGPKYRIDLIRPRGNDKTKPVVITREMAIKPGDRYDVREIQESVRRLRNLRYFDEVEITPVDSNRKGPDDTRYKDLVVRVKEANTRRLFIGAGASSAIGVFGDFRYEDANFDLADWPSSWGDFVSGSALSGGGQTLSVFLQPGSNASQFGIDWREPWLNDRPIELDVSVGYFTRDWDDYTVSKLGGSVTIGKRFQPNRAGPCTAGASGREAQMSAAYAKADPATAS